MFLDLEFCRILIVSKFRVLQNELNQKLIRGLISFKIIMLRVNLDHT